MKVISITKTVWLLVIVCLTATGVLSQPAESSNKITFSLDLASTLYPPPDTSLVPDLLDNLRGFEGWRKINFHEDRLVPVIGANLHHKKWTGGIVAQLKRKSEFDVVYEGESVPDRLRVIETRLSFYAERYFNLDWFKRASPFMRFGVTRTERSASRVRTGIEGGIEDVEVTPLLCTGFFLDFKFAQLRLEHTKRFGDSDDVASITMGIRIPFGTRLH